MKVMKFIEWNRPGSYRQEGYFCKSGESGRQRKIVLRYAVTI